MADTPDSGEPQAAMPMNTPVSTPAPPSNTPQAGVGGPPPPMGGGLPTPVQALGRMAEARNKAKAMVTVLQRDLYGAFEFNSDEGKAIQKALSALGPVFGGGGKEEGDRNAAMMAMRQRAMAMKGMQGPPSPQPNRGPIPAVAGAPA